MLSVANIIHDAVTECDDFHTDILISLVEYKVIPLQALRVPGGQCSKISRQSAHVGGKVVSPRQRPPLPPQEIFLVLISVTG